MYVVRREYTAGENIAVHIFNNGSTSLLVSVINANPQLRALNPAASCQTLRKWKYTHRPQREGDFYFLVTRTFWVFYAPRNVFHSLPAKHEHTFPGQLMSLQFLLFLGTASAARKYNLKGPLVRIKHFSNFKQFSKQISSQLAPFFLREWFAPAKYSIMHFTYSLYIPQSHAFTGRLGKNIDPDPRIPASDLHPQAPTSASDPKSAKSD